MSSPKRQVHAGAVLHVVQRGVNRMPVFNDARDFGWYRQSLLDATQRYGSGVHAYVFMTNHVHLLVTCRDERSVPLTMQSVGSRYVRYFNARYARTGTLWESRYRSALIDSDRYLLACMRYIEMNPVRAGLSQDPAAYAWSSYRANRSGTPDPLVTVHGAYEALGHHDASRRCAYAAFFEAEDREAERAIRAGLHPLSSRMSASGQRKNDERAEEASLALG